MRATRFVIFESACSKELSRIFSKLVVIRCRQRTFYILHRYVLEVLVQAVGLEQPHLSAICNSVENCFSLPELLYCVWRKSHIDFGFCRWRHRTQATIRHLRISCTTFSFPLDRVEFISSNSSSNYFIESSSTCTRTCSDAELSAASIPLTSSAPS